MKNLSGVCVGGVVDEKLFRTNKFFQCPGISLEPATAELWQLLSRSQPHTFRISYMNLCSLDEFSCLLLQVSLLFSKLMKPLSAYRGLYRKDMQKMPVTSIHFRYLCQQGCTSTNYFFITVVIFDLFNMFAILSTYLQTFFFNLVHPLPKKTWFVYYIIFRVKN